MGEGDTAAGDWLDCFSLQLGSVVFLLESIYFHLFIIEMNTITINEKNLVNICEYIYIKKILMPIQPLGNLLCGVIEALLW